MHSSFPPVTSLPGAARWATRPWTRMIPTTLWARRSSTTPGMLGSGSHRATLAKFPVLQREPAFRISGYRPCTSLPRACPRLVPQCTGDALPARIYRGYPLIALFRTWRRRHSPLFRILPVAPNHVNARSDVPIGPQFVQDGPKVKPRNLHAYWPFGRANGGGHDARGPGRVPLPVDSTLALV